MTTGFYLVLISYYSAAIVPERYATLEDCNRAANVYTEAAKGPQWNPRAVCLPAPVGGR